MWFVVICVLLTVGKLLDLSFLINVSWWYVVLFAALAAVWWWVADVIGYSAHKEMQKFERRKHERIQRNKEVLGLGKHPPKRRR